MAELTLGLQNLRRQVNERFPHRDKTSDGWIGDAAHQAHTSGHNPDDTPGSMAAWNGDSDTKPEVRAWDQDSDLGEPGVTAQMEVDHIIRLPGVETVIRYVIYNHYWWHERDGFTKQPYTGPSPHEEHIHFEGAWSNAGDSNTTFNFRLGELGDTMSKQDALDALTEFFAPTGKIADGSYSSRIGQNAFNQSVPNPFDPTGKKTEAWRLLQNTAQAVKALAASQGVVDVDENVIIAGVLAGLSPERIAALIPENIAQDVVNLLAARIQG
jgi:hypothetical protein